MGNIFKKEMRASITHKTVKRNETGVIESWHAHEV